MERPVIYFDWDGTIADSMPLCIGEISLALERMGLPPMPVEKLKACNGPTYEESVAVLGLPAERAGEFLRLRKEAEMELVPTVQQFFPGIRGMLDELRSFADLAIVSNGLQEYLELSTRVMQVEDCFVRLQAHIPGKSKAEALGMLIAEMRPERCVMVGDRLGDITAGKANGIPTVAACYGFGNDEEYNQADYRVNSAEEMTALLRKLLV
ncbi:MAG: HAD family hydrolase [Clostridiales bacterium]|nr:HAD family hydrolase [Clostridiales bacterium]